MEEVVVVDGDFLSQIEAAEVSAVKRRKINEEEKEGAYTAALKGSRSLSWQQHQSISTPLKGGILGDGDGSSTNNACFKCGKLGHWARDCTTTVSTGGGGGGGVPEKACSCGLGSCIVLVANTEKIRGRKFYRCPLRQENGGCGFFEWCDNSSTPTSARAHSYMPNSSFPDVPCPCGAGSCLVLIARTGKNIGQQFFRCPAHQANICRSYAKQNIQYW